MVVHVSSQAATVTLFILVPKSVISVLCIPNGIFRDVSSWVFWHGSCIFFSVTCHARSTPTHNPTTSRYVVVACRDGGALCCYGFLFFISWTAHFFLGGGGVLHEYFCNSRKISAGYWNCTAVLLHSASYFVGLQRNLNWTVNLNLSIGICNIGRQEVVIIIWHLW
jgi:hypothetical protein